jgi:MFS family permease
VNYRLLIFASCIVLFQLANASLMPLVSEELAQEHGSSLVVSALISVPQIVVAILAPRVGSEADRWGRRPVLLIGLSALPINAVCLAFVDHPLLLVTVQILSGVSAAVIGVLTPLIIADITKGTGRCNLGQGIVGTLSGIGAALSTTVSGVVAQARRTIFGNPDGSARQRSTMRSPTSSEMRMIWRAWCSEIRTTTLKSRSG